jgi:hypothetical protein
MSISTALDFDAVWRDPEAPTRAVAAATRCMAATVYRALADSIDLGLFDRQPSSL